MKLSDNCNMKTGNYMLFFISTAKTKTCVSRSEFSVMSYRSHFSSGLFNISTPELTFIVRNMELFWQTRHFDFLILFNS